jgi:hypothetical protein
MRFAIVKSWKYLAIVLGAMLGVESLTGCASQAQHPDSPMPVPSTSSLPWYAQKPVSQPSSQRAAVTAAVNAVDADQTGTAEIMERKIPSDSIVYFESGAWLKAVSVFLEEFRHTTLPPLTGQPPVWLPDTTRSSVMPLESGGNTYRFGRVTMVGCFHVDEDFIPASNGSRVSETQALPGYIPYKMTVVYEPTTQTWLVTRGTYLTPSTGAPACPPTHA